MQYTIFELERIEKILQAKLQEAEEAYAEREQIVIKNFKASHIEDVLILGEADGIPSKTWEDFRLRDMDLMFLWGEVDLFKRGINTLYSYWNSSVEIFIDNLREKAEAAPEKKRYVDPLSPEKLKFIKDNE